MAWVMLGKTRLSNKPKGLTTEIVSSLESDGLDALGADWETERVTQPRSIAETPTRTGLLPNDRSGVGGSGQSVSRSVGTPAYCKFLAPPTLSLQVSAPGVTP